MAAETKEEKEAREAKEAEEKAAKEAAKAGYVVAPITLTSEKHGGRKHTGGNLIISKNAKIDAASLNENEKKSMVYFPGEKIPAGIKPALIKQWIDDGNIITAAEYKKIIEKQAEEAAKKEAEAKKRR